MNLSPLGWYHVFAFGVFVPFLALRSSRRAANPAAPPPDRMTHFRMTTATLVAFGGFSWLTARQEHLTIFSTDVTKIVFAVPAALAMYVVAVLFMRPRWRRAVEKRVRVVHLFMPSTARERAWWFVVAILAGVSEEVSWRGVQTTLLAGVMGSAGAGALVSAAAFGVAHAMQGWRSALIIVVFALAFQGLVWLSGSLYLAMAVHAAYDITAGLTYGRLGRDSGYQLAEARELSSSSPHASGTPL